MISQTDLELRCAEFQWKRRAILARSRFRNLNNHRDVGTCPALMVCYSERTKIHHGDWLSLNAAQFGSGTARAKWHSRCQCECHWTCAVRLVLQDYRREVDRCNVVSQFRSNKDPHSLDYVIKLLGR